MRTVEKQKTSDKTGIEKYYGSIPKDKISPEVRAKAGVAERKNPEAIARQQ